MKEVLALIETRKQEFAKLPLFRFLQDKNIDPKERLSWAPCLTPLAMGFAQLNKYDFRKEPTSDPIQAIINQYTYEDDYHWQWFLEDLEKLGLNYSIKFCDAARFYWGAETQKTRQVCHQIALHTFRAEPVVVLSAIAAIEATGNVAFALTTQIVEELQKTNGKNYRYFGNYHLLAESDHVIGFDDIELLMKNIELTEEQKTKSFEIVDKVFELFTEATHEMKTYAEKQSIVKLITV
ncbi:hypothetical protein [Anabaena azotica]|uniref:Uncharacterized protein n=1 Tax=Anabaena azotica FACHB-119 TaxID=947527 RepID=A0ABR8DCH8_9NOST|nr:hypothetical protein [Anabaena azotica]MBD2504819.1 hypothetical protein [Anabaena azotica FACHB-119]